jgi:hypothetical protein
MSYLNPSESRVTPIYGVGRVKAEIYFRSTLLGDDIPLERMLDYCYQETVNGLEVFIENPKIRNASSLDEDIREAIKNDMKGQAVQFDNLIINFY